ncbi:MAG: hypothetical protein U5P10_12645 [Spirochaetia bacterium]|nr:hypothetical protein [Spirochaetia bacterium]
MFKIGFGEILLLGLIALIFINPRELPKLFHKAGQLSARLRRLKREFDETMSRFEEEVKHSEDTYRREGSGSTEKPDSPGDETSAADDSQEDGKIAKHESRTHNEASTDGLPPEEYRNRTKEE